QIMAEFKVPELPKTGQNEENTSTREIELKFEEPDKIDEDDVQPSSSSSPIRIYDDGGMTMHGYTAAQFAGLAPVNGLDLQCKMCHRLLVDPLTTICNHTLCTRCFNTGTLPNHPDPCPMCGNIFGPVSIWYFVQSTYDETSKAIHSSRNALLEQYFSSPMVRGRFDCVNQIHEMTNPKEVYVLFRDIFWFFKNPENEQLLQRAFAHTFLRLMSRRLKRKINEQVKRVFQMEVELGYLKDLNNYTDSRLMEAFMDDFPDRAEKCKSLFTETDRTGNLVTRCTTFPDHLPERMVLTHLPCNSNLDAIVCTQPGQLPSDHGHVYDVTKRDVIPDGNRITFSPSERMQRAPMLPFVKFVGANSAPVQNNNPMSRPTTSRIAFDPANDADNEDDEPMDVVESDGEMSSQSNHAFAHQRLSDNSDTPIAVYIAGGEKVFHSKSHRCPPIMKNHSCLHNECCKCGFEVGIHQYYSALPGLTRKGMYLPIALSDKIGEEPIWDPDANPPVALSNYSYPMFTTEYLENRVDGLIEKQEKEALALYERIRDKNLRSRLVQVGEEAYGEGGYDMFTGVGKFIDDATKYLRMDKMTEFLYKFGSCVSCMDFDTTGTLLAVGGTAKAIRVYDFEDQLRDCRKSSEKITNALLEIPAVSKLSGLKWCRSDPTNLIFTEYDGIATLYDVNERKEIRRFKDHNRRIWDVALATNDASKLFATCGDDGKVYMYHTGSTAITNTIDIGFATTSIEFCPWNDYEVAVGVSDATVNIYDTRYTKHQFMQLRGHRKAVSYVRYMDRGPGEYYLVSAAIDSSIQMWNLEDSKWKCERTFKGHVNEKNFTGFATMGEHIVTGSEGNDIVLYHQFFSNPMVRVNFLENADSQRTACELDEQHDRNDFVSCLKWKKHTNIIVAANNQGMIQAYKAH
ncbi:hypothetical protein PRIPAC_74244, partial [Pristionchus pacificus]